MTIIRAIGDPYQRFTEDYLRILRAIRFSTKFDFEIHPNTYQAILELYQNLNKISRERIRDEFTKILQSKNRAKGITVLYDTGIIDLIIPKFSELAYIDQPPIYHPEGDVLVHTVLTLSQAEENDSIWLLLSILLHDIGKTDTYSFDKEKQRVTFIDHDMVGAEKSKIILRDLKYDNDTIEKVYFLISNHMLFHQDISKLRKSTIKRVMLTKTDQLQPKYILNPLFDDLVKLYKYDVLGSDKNLTDYYILLRIIDEIKEELKRQPPAHLITGYDIMELGIRPGPIISGIMTKVEDAQLEGTIQSREDALKYLKDHLKDLIGE